MSEGCNIDDILCQLRVLDHLQGIERLIGSESFLERYPEFNELGNKVREDMAQHQGTLAELMKKCATPEQPEEQLEQEPGLEYGQTGN